MRIDIRDLERSLSQKPIVAKPQKPQDQQPTKPDRTVLVVDDDIEALAVFSAVLRQKFSVATAANEEGALSEYNKAEGGFGVVMIDLDLDKTEADTGLRVMSAIKKIRPSQKIILISGHERVARIAGEKGTDYIAKPVRTADLLMKVESVMRAGDKIEDHARRIALDRKHWPLGGMDQSLEPDAISLANSDAAMIHKANLGCAPENMPDNTMLCHIIAEPAIPAGQRTMLQELEQQMRNKDDMHEKLVRLEINDPDNLDEFMTKLEEVRQREEKFYKGKGYNVEFDVACHRQGLVNAIQDRYKVKVQDKHEFRVNALAFTRAEGTDAIQVEGIMLALRALRTNDIGKLLAAYKLITGKAMITDRTDANELARDMLFVMPAAIDINRIDTLNRLIKENIWQAA
jgi:ActR/RegA family two-component response regulator